LQESFQAQISLPALIPIVENKMYAKMFVGGGVNTNFKNLLKLNQIKEIATCGIITIKHKNTRYLTFQRLTLIKL